MTRFARLLAAFAMTAAVLCAVAQGQVTLTDNGPTGSGTNYYAGDYWTIFISSPYPNSGVDMCDPSGCTSGGFYGNTDSNGSFYLSGQFATNDSGSWGETWYVGGVAIGSINFYVNPAPSPGNCSLTAPPSFINFAAYANYTYPVNSGNPWTLSSAGSGSATLQADSQNCTVTDNFTPDNYIAGNDNHFGGQDVVYLNATNAASPAEVGFDTVWDNGWLDTCGGPIAVYLKQMTFQAAGSGFSGASSTSQVELDVYGCFYTN